jgi:hypothetical protein
MSLRYKGGIISSVAPTTSGTPYTGVAQGIWSMEDQIQAKAAGLWPASAGVPDAPTAITVTANDTQAVVGFTPPVNDGGTAITGYTTTSSPGNISVSGASSPITVTGLTNGTTYTFTVVATNVSGNSVPSAASVPVAPTENPHRNAIFAFGYLGGTATYSNVTNLISSTGIIATDTVTVATGRSNAMGAPYGVGNAVIAFGYIDAPSNIKNTVNSSGVVSSDTTTSPASHRLRGAGARYGTDTAIMGYAENAGSSYTTTTNLISNTGVFASDVTSPTPAVTQGAAAHFGNDKAIFGFGSIYGPPYGTNQTHIVSNTGVVASGVTTVGDIKYELAAAGYGVDKAIFGFGVNVSIGAVTATINLISNTGVMAATTTSVGTARQGTPAATYAGDKAIFGTGSSVNITNLVSNTGVVAANVALVGTNRSYPAGTSYN